MSAGTSRRFADACAIDGMIFKALLLNKRDYHGRALQCASFAVVLASPAIVYLRLRVATAPVLSALIFILMRAKALIYATDDIALRLPDIRGWGRWAMMAAPRRGRQTMLIYAPRHVYIIIYLSLFPSLAAPSETIFLEFSELLSDLRGRMSLMANFAHFLAFYCFIYVFAYICHTAVLSMAISIFDD